jgi:hypothetical protein
MCNQSGWENIKQAKGKEYFPFFHPLTPLLMFVIRKVTKFFKASTVKTQD